MEHNWFEYADGKWVDWNQILGAAKQDTAHYYIHFIGGEEPWLLSDADSVKILSRIAREANVR